MEQETTSIQTGNVTIRVPVAEVETKVEYAIGDPVKLLLTEYGDARRSVPGVLVGVDLFETQPTLIVAYLDTRYASSGDSLKFAYINEANAERYEICKANPKDIPISRKLIEEEMLAAIRRKEEEIRNIRFKLEFFQQNFGQYFGETGDES